MFFDVICFFDSATTHACSTCSQPRTPSRRATRRFMGAPLEGQGARCGVPAEAPCCAVEIVANHQESETTTIKYWLVVWNMFSLFFHILGIIIPTD